MKQTRLTLASDVAQFLASQSDGGVAFIEAAVRAHVKTRAPASAPAPETEEALARIEKRSLTEARRAAALSRYPQLIDALARELITIDRAEAMAQDADSRR